MKALPRSAPRATKRLRTPLGAQQPKPKQSRTSDGPAPAWAPEAAPSAAVPAAHHSEPPGSPSSRRSPSPLRPLRIGDAADLHAWLTAARTTADDLVAAAREGTRRLKHRVLSRAELRRRVRVASAELTRLLDAATAGFDAPAGEGGHGG